MTDITWLQAAQERCDAATEGPWTACREEGTGWDIIGSQIYEDWRAQFWLKADAVFCAHARRDLPLALELLEQARALFAEVEWVREETWEICPWCHGFRGFGGHAADCGREAWLARLDAGGDE